MNPVTYPTREAAKAAINDLPFHQGDLIRTSGRNYVRPGVALDEYEPTVARVHCVLERLWKDGYVLTVVADDVEWMLDGTEKVERYPVSARARGGKWYLTGPNYENLGAYSTLGLFTTQVVARKVGVPAAAVSIYPL